MNNNRKNNYLASFGTGAILQVISLIISFITIPISITYWGNEKYGIFAIITSIMAYLAMTNLGMNYAAITLMGKIKGDKNKDIIFKKTRNLVLLSEIIVFLFLIIFQSKIHSFLNDFMGASSLYSDEIYKSLKYMVVFFFINTAFSVYDGYFYAYQKLYIQNILECINRVLSICVLLLTIHFKGDISFLILLSGIYTIILNIVKMLYWNFFLKKREMEIENIECYKEELGYKNIFLTGISFFLINTAGGISANLDNLVINKYMRLNDVTDYSIIVKIFQMSFLFIPIINNSMMPHFAKEFSNTNWNWINKTYKNLFAMTVFLAGGIYVSGLFLFDKIIFLVTNGRVTANIYLVCVYGIYIILISINNLNSGLLGTFNYVKGKFWLVGWGEMIFKLVLMIFLVKKYNLFGIIIGTLVSYSFGTFYFTIRRLLSGSNKKLQINFRHLKKMLLFLSLITLAKALSLNFNFDKAIDLLLAFTAIIVYVLVSYRVLEKENKEYIKGKLIFLRSKK